MKKGISRNSLKLIAATSMVLDHTSALFLDQSSFFGLSLRFVGRITFPIMAFMIAEGYYRTKNFNKYIWRLIITGVISVFACYIYNQTIIPANAIFTLTLGLLGIKVYNMTTTMDIKIALSFILICFAIISDYGIWGILLTVLFGIFKNNKHYQIIMFFFMAIIGIIMNINNNPIVFAGLFLTIPILILYNQNKYEKTKFKHFFYYFYPLHLIILKLAKIIIS